MVKVRLRDLLVVRPAIVTLSSSKLSFKTAYKVDTYIDAINVHIERYVKLHNECAEKYKDENGNIDQDADKYQDYINEMIEVEDSEVEIVKLDIQIEHLLDEDELKMKPSEIKLIRSYIELENK